MQNELRESIDSNDWSIISTVETSSKDCYLCPSSEDETEEKFSIKDEKGRWLVRSIVDPYPITHPSKFKLKNKDGIFKKYTSHGWSEIIIENRDHTKELHELTSEEIKNILLAYIDRIKSMRERENVEFIGLTKDNLKVEFEHTHSRIFTMPVIPEIIKEKINNFNDYKFKKENCFYCDLIEKEKNSPRRIFDNKSFIVFSPFSQRNDYEIWILPKKHHTCLTKLNEFEIFTLAETIKNILTRMKIALKPFKYSMIFYLKPNKNDDFHFHISIFQKRLSSSLKEGYGIGLCRLSPENIAKILRGK